MATEHCDKIDIARVLIERIDGVVAKARVSTLALANAVLERWARDVPEQCEAQCDIHIFFEDGFHCLSRIGIRPSQKRISVSRHLRRQLSAMASQARGRAKPSSGAAIIGSAHALPAAGVDAILARYDI